MTDWYATEFELRAGPIYARITRGSLCWRWSVRSDGGARHMLVEDEAASVEEAQAAAARVVEQIRGMG